MSGRLLLVVAVAAALAAAHGGSHKAHENKIPNDRGQPGSFLVSLRVEGECEAAFSRMQRTEHYPERHRFTKMPSPMPQGVPAQSLASLDPADWGMVGLSPTHVGMTWLLTYEDEDGALFGQTFLDPRIRVGESRFGPAPDGPIDEVHLHHARVSDDGSQPLVHHVTPFPDIHVAWIPLTAKSVTAYCRNTSVLVARHSTTKTMRREFSAKAGALPEFWVVQKSGPVESQHNFVFLSAGYLDNQASRDAFNATINRLVSGMNGGTTGDGYDTMHQTVPFDRYWPFYNVFGVFQASPEVGASRPLSGLTVNNNLGCYHPATLERAVTCSIDQVLALAEITPAQVLNQPDRTIIIVIVNTNLYGGSAVYREGQFHIGHFYRGYTDAVTSTDFDSSTYDGLKFNSLVKHETGHAYGQLFDEYDIGISEPSALPLANCVPPQNVPSKVQWQEWIDLVQSDGSLPSKYQVGTGKFTVAKSPLPTCGYSNYMRPNSNCMMQAVRDYFMCPVCREAATKTILSQPQLSYAWPRFPMDQAVLILPLTKPATTTVPVMSVDTSAVLYLPSAVRPSNDFVVRWKAWDGSDMSNCRSRLTTDDYFCPPETSTLVLSARYLRQLEADTVLTFTAYIDDVTRFMLDSTRAPLAEKMNQTTKFMIKIVSDFATVEPTVNLTDSVAGASSTFAVGRAGVGFDVAFYTYCNSSVCRQSFTASPYANPPGLDALVGSFDSWALYMQAGVGLVFVILWVWAYNYYTAKSSRVVRPIFRNNFTGIVNWIRRIMLFSAVMFMLSALGSLAVSAYFYTKTSSLGKIIIVIGTVLAFGLYIMAFIGYWAVTYRSKKLVIVNGGVLYFGLTLLVVTNALAISIGSNIKDPNSYWNQNLESFWSNLVLYNGDRACAIQGMLQCSGFYYACNSVIQSTTECPTNCDVNNRNFGTACQLLLSDYISDNYIVINQVLGVCVFMMFCGLVFNFVYFVGLAKMKKDIQKANDARIHKHASKTNATVKQVDRCKALFILKTLDDGDMSHLVKEFNRIDEDGNGQLDRQEFTNFFKRALCYKPSAGEIDEIFRVADLDGDGTISMDEFLCIFNKSVVTSNAGSRTAMRRTIDPAREAEVKRRAAKVFGDDMDTGASTIEMDPHTRSAGYSSPNGVLSKPLPTNKAAPTPAYRPTKTQIPDPEGLL